MRRASRFPSLSSMANSGCLLLSGAAAAAAAAGMLPHSLQCPPAFLYLPEVRPTTPLLLYLRSSLRPPAAAEAEAAAFVSAAVTLDPWLWWRSRGEVAARGKGGGVCAGGLSVLEEVGGSRGGAGGESGEGG